MGRLFAGRYRLIKRLGGGAQGIALQVEDTLAGDIALLKIGRSGAEGHDGTITEFEALRALSTPHIAPVLGLGFAGEQDLNLVATLGDVLLETKQARPYLVRAWIDGPHLLDWAARLRSTLPVRDANERLLSVLSDLTEAIAELHQSGLIHGDLKPDHVLIQTEGEKAQPILIDFGMASIRDGSGTLGGTPGYLAPERIKGHKATVESDRFALGVIMTQALVGEHTQVLATQTSSDLPEPLLEQRLPERVVQTIRRLLSAEASQRPPLETVRMALIPPSETVETSDGGRWCHLPFLGKGRHRTLDTLLERALSPDPGLPAVLLLCGERGSGRSRMLRQIGWALQRTGRPALELFGGDRSWHRLLSLGPQLASLSGCSFVEPNPLDHGAERTKWLEALANALTAVLPPSPLALMWDDIGEEPTEGLETVEGLAVTMERCPELRLWATTTPDRLETLRSLFAAQGFEVVELEPLSHEDCEGLLEVGPLAGRLSEGELERVWRLSAGNPSRLASLLQGEGEALETTTNRSLIETVLLALCGLMAGGATASELEKAGAALGKSAADVRRSIERCLQKRLISVCLPRADAPRQRALTAPFVRFDRLTPHARHTLGQALTAFSAEKPHIDLLASALMLDSEGVIAAWRRHRHQIAAQQRHTLALLVLEAALSATDHTEILNDFIETALDSGQLGMSIRALERVSVACPTSQWAQSLEVALLRLSFAAGQDVSARAAALSGGLEGTELSHVANILSQSLLRRSRFAEARERAQEGLEAIKMTNSDQARALRAHLWVNAAAAQVMLGDDDHGELERVYGRLEIANITARARARYQAMRAVASYMQGNLDKATECYLRALAIVDEEGIDTDRCVYQLNVGTAYERQGRLSMARHFYHLGARSSLPTTRATTKALLLANRANIDIKLGRPDEARELLAAAGRIAAETPQSYVTLFIDQLKADADASDGHLSEAQAVYLNCATSFRELGDKRHACELFLKAGLAAARADEHQRARKHLDCAQLDIEEFSDLKRRAGILRAEIILSKGGSQAMLGVDRYLRALDRTLEDGDDLTVLTESRWLLKRLRAHGASPDPLALRELKAITERAWRRAALSLTPELRRDMAKHLDIDALLHHSPSAPQAATFGDQASLAGVNISTPHLGHTQPMSRPSLRPHSPPDALERQVLTTSERFFRMLSLSRRIIGESDLKRLIPAALDIALSLSGAERGFVLIRDEDDGPFEIAFSADVHGKPIAEEDLKFSATIAREVARQGHPILTNDAGQDQRFGDARSVHQLQFTSILCVPIRDRHRILGCLYLDHTGNPEVFGGIVPRMMSSHADQVAIALLSARQAAEVRSERDELKRAQARIRALLQEKEALLMDLETRCNGLEEDLARERNTSGLRYNYENLIARAPSMVRVLSQVDRVVDTMLPVVIQGASGTGKEVIARAMHFNGPRRSGSFVPINCGALAETLLESELFGHKKGAFTGAFADRKGLFESASGGTLFLDEVGEMSLSMQVKLLRALQESKIRPVGAVHEIDVDVRVLAATNRDLVEMISAGTFREDLYYRLATLVVELPPLRERREDIPLLVRHILKRATKDSASTPPTVTGPAVALLMQHHWPGNIRQLENVIHASMVMCDDAITPEVLLPLMPRSAATAFNPPAVAVKMRPHPGRPPKCTREEILGAMELFEGNRARAAEHLGVSLRTLQRYLKQLYQGPDTA